MATGNRKSISSVHIAITSLTTLLSQSWALPGERLQGQCVSDLFIVSEVDRVDALHYEKMMGQQSIPVPNIEDADKVFLHLAGIMSKPGRQKIANCLPPDVAE